jgi:hypothetical protein
LDRIKLQFEKACKDTYVSIVDFNDKITVNFSKDGKSFSFLSAKKDFLKLSDNRIRQIAAISLHCMI